MCRRRHTPCPQRRGTLAPPYRLFVGDDAHIVPPAPRRQKMSLRTSAHTGVAIRTPPAQHHIRGTDCHVAPLLAMTFYENHSAMRRGRRLPAVVPADSRPLSWPPIGALPRNRLASPATGGASPISPTTRMQALHAPRRGRRPRRPARTAPPCLAPVGRGDHTPPPARAAPACYPLWGGTHVCRRRHTPHPQRRGTLAPPYRLFIGDDAHIVPPAPRRQKMSLRTSAHTGVAIRNTPAPHLHSPRRRRRPRRPPAPHPLVIPL